MGKDSSGLVHLGVDAPYEMATLTPLGIRAWSERALHVVKTDLEFQKRGILWGHIHPGVHETILAYLKATKKPAVKFEYPGNAAQQSAFATETSAPAIKKRTDFHVKWLAQLGEDFGAARGDQSAILRIVSSVKFRWDGDYNSDAVFQLMQAINLALLNVNWQTADNQQMKVAVLEHVDAELACEITNSGTEAENWKEMLTRVMREFLSIDKTKGLARAAKRRSAQDQEGRDSKRQAKGGSASSELESNWKWTGRGLRASIANGSERRRAS